MTAMETLADALARTRAQIEDGLRARLAPAAAPTPFDQALAHAVMGGGKRVRPSLTLLCAEACGGEAGPGSDAHRAALAVELLHCYTLVHDDLPAMDDDAERRGQPSVWAKFGEDTAILAGDRLQAMAFAGLAECRRAAALVAPFAHAACAVVDGQAADLDAAKRPPETWDKAALYGIYDLKTAALIRLACRLGAIAADAPEPTQTALADYGREIGLAFQLVDDLLDAGQADAGEGLNAIRILGADEVRRLAGRHTQAALEALGALPGGAPTLRAFAQSLLTRLV